MDIEAHTQDLFALINDSAEDTGLGLDAFLDLSDMASYLTETVVQIFALTAALPCRACGGATGAVALNDREALASATDAVTGYLCGVGLLDGSLEDVTSDLFSPARVQALCAELAADGVEVPAGLGAVADALQGAVAAGWADEIDEALDDGGTYRFIGEHPCSCEHRSENHTRVIVTPPVEAVPVSSPADAAKCPRAPQKAATQQELARRALARWLVIIDGGS